MAVAITFTVRNDNPATIWSRLAARIGREPTSAEARAEVLRILRGEPSPAPVNPHAKEA